MWDFLAMNLRNSAEWRKSVAQRHPEDAKRNLHASKLLDRLADEIEVIDDPDLSARYAKASGEELTVSLGEAEQEEIQFVGFHSEPENGRAFVESVLRRVGV